MSKKLFFNLFDLKFLNFILVGVFSFIFQITLTYLFNSYVFGEFFISYYVALFITLFQSFLMHCFITFSKSAISLNYWIKYFFNIGALALIQILLVNILSYLFSDLFYILLVSIAIGLQTLISFLLMKYVIFN